MRFIKQAAAVKILSIFMVIFMGLHSATAADFTNNNQTRVSDESKFQVQEIINAGHAFFGTASTNIASIVETMFSQSGKSSAYIIGEEGSGSLVIGARYGEGYIYFRDGSRYKIFWQGPSIGFDFGADASKTMVLVYNVDDPNMLIKRFPGVDGSAYFIGGLGVTYQQNSGDSFVALIYQIMVEIW